MPLMNEAWATSRSKEIVMVCGTTMSMPYWEQCAWILESA